MESPGKLGVKGFEGKSLPNVIVGLERIQNPPRLLKYCNCKEYSTYYYYLSHLFIDQIPFCGLIMSGIVIDQIPFCGLVKP
jgi:hypothetical protein